MLGRLACCRFQHGALLFVGVILCLLPTQTRAMVWRVSPTGEADFTHIQPALDAAAPWDTVIVGPGTYGGNATTRTINGSLVSAEAWLDKPLTFLAEPNSILDGSILGGPVPPAHHAICSVTPDSVTVRGFWLKDFDYGFRALGRAVISHTLLEDNGIAVVGTFSSTAISVDSCQIVKTSARTGIFAALEASIRVTDTTFEGWGDGVVLLAAAHAELVGCTFIEAGMMLDAQQGSTAEIRGCEGVQIGSIGIVSLGVGTTVHLAQTTIRGNAEGAPIAGLHAEQGAILTGHHVSVSSFDIGVRGSSEGLLSLESSNITDWQTHSVKLTDYTVAPLVEWQLEGCYWGLPDSTSIADSIWDVEDDPVYTAYGKVVFWPASPIPVERASTSFSRLKALFQEKIE